jgi:hypothetical protein
MLQLLQMLKLSLRFVLPLLLAVAALAYLSVPLIDRLTLRWFMSDLDQRSHAIAATVAGPLREAYRQGAEARIAALLDAAATDERLQSAALCDARGEIIARSAQFPSSVSCAPSPARRASGCCGCCRACCIRPACRFTSARRRSRRTPCWCCTT